MTNLLIPLLVFMAVTAIGGAILLTRAARQRMIHARIEGFGPIDDEENQGTPALLRFVHWLGTSMSLGGGAEAMRRDMMQAGYYGQAAPAIFLGFRFLMAIAGIAGAALVLTAFDYSLPVKMMLTLGAGWLLSIIPRFIVEARKNTRMLSVQNHLPDAVDLLEICVTSGMGLDMAWNTVTDEIRRVSPILADEMALTNLEMHLGVGRAAAMRHMAERTNSEDLSSLVGVLVQSEKFGTSVGEALRTFATSMRETRSARAAENAEKMGVKMLIPMILFIFPAILVVIGGSAIIKIIEIFN